MKLAVVSASLLAFGLMAGNGFAATTAAPAMTDTAAIKTIDLKAHQITLDDGKMFSLPAKWTLHAYKTGEKVTVSYTDHMGSMTVTKIKRAA